MAREVKLSASITRHYGKVSAEFGASMIFDIDEKNPARASYYKLVQLIHYQFDEFEANHLKHEAVELPGTGAIANPADGSQWFDAVKLIKNIVKGKESFAIITAEAAYSQHGAPCYPEFLTEYHLIEYLNGKTELVFEPGTKVLVDRTGKYKKCIRLQKGIVAAGD